MLKPSLNPGDLEVLAYVHSNKFITTKLFHKKFHPHQSFKTACLHLRVLEERGYLLKYKKFPNDDTYHCLTRPALRRLLEAGRILISPEVRSPRINLFEREHDKRLVEMRIQIEADPDLAGLLWLSDYEMRCGLKWEWKKALVEGRGAELKGTHLYRQHVRTPDGCFAAWIGENRYSFILEYEHSTYNRAKIADMVLSLSQQSSKAFRLVVSRDKEHTMRMAQGLRGCLKGNPLAQPLWAVSFYEKVISLPFTKVPWLTLEGKYLPFVKEPVLKSAS